MASTKTRGPRTPDERATDAARSAATLFERLPATHYADTVLRPLAALLRFDHSTAYVDQEQTEEAADAYRDVVDHWRSVEELEISHRRHFEAEGLGQLTRRLHAAVDQLEELGGFERPKPKLALVPEANADA